MVFIIVNIFFLNNDIDLSSINEEDNFKITINNIYLEGYCHTLKNYTNEKGSTNTYTLNVKRLTLNESLSSNTNINKFEIKNYNINFSNGVSDYIIKLKNEISTYRILGNEELKDNNMLYLIISNYY